MNQAERIKAAMQRKGMNSSDLARACGVSRPAVGQWLSQDTKAPKAENIFKIARATGVSAEWLTTGKGLMTPEASKDGSSDTNDSDGSPPHESDYALIPQLSAKGQNGSAGYLNDHVEVTGGLAFKRAWLAKMHVKPANLSIIYAEGASMEPYIIEGDVVLIDHGCVEPVSGQVYALRRPDNGISIKRLIQQMSGEWILSSDNPNKAKYRDEPVSADSVCQVPIIGRVVWRGGAMA